MKPLIVLVSFAVLSICITSACIINGVSTGGFLLANLVAGAAIGLVSGMFP